jgi:hypothetical protein
MQYMDPIAAKQGMFSHGYQISDTIDRVTHWRAFEAQALALGKPTLTRGEQDGEWNICGWSKQNPEQAFYWSALFALHCGLDVWNIPLDALASVDIDETVNFFNFHAGYQTAEASPGAFCALARGLDASDTDLYPEDQFGKADRKNQDRYVKIAEHFAPYGAIQGDPPEATGTGMRNRQADDYNDVGWRIWPGNFETFLHQIDPDATSVARWHVAPSKHAYSRFARSFEQASDRTRMAFYLDPEFYGDATPQKVWVRVAYLDAGDGKWTLTYATPNGKATAATVQNADSGTWKSIEVELDDAVFSRALDADADLALEQLEGADVTFHLIELRRR